jgi:hypothetical protein
MDPNQRPPLATPNPPINPQHVAAVSQPWPQQQPVGTQDMANAPTPEQMAAIEHQRQLDAQTQPPVLPLAEIDQFKKNLAYLYTKALELTGVPLDLILREAFKHAAMQQIPLQGFMADYGDGAQFVPDTNSTTVLINSYFDRAVASGMPEA